MDSQMSLQNEAAMDQNFFVNPGMWLFQSSAVDGVKQKHFYSQLYATNKVVPSKKSIESIAANEACLFLNSKMKMWQAQCTCVSCLQSISIPPIRKEDLKKCVFLMQPTLSVTYQIRCIYDYELPVKGAYIDPRITPGFRYSVRFADSEKLVFENAKTLLSIGMGYGRRFTFESESKLKNTNFFWSDSHVEGYAFENCALGYGEEFALISCDSSEALGRTEVQEVLKEQYEIASELLDDRVVKQIHVAFYMHVFKNMSSSVDNCPVFSNVPVNGIVHMEKMGKSNETARITSIEDLHLPRIGKCRLIPLEQFNKSESPITVPLESDED